MDSAQPSATAQLRQDHQLQQDYEMAQDVSKLPLDMYVVLMIQLAIVAHILNICVLLILPFFVIYM